MQPVMFTSCPCCNCKVRIPEAGIAENRQMAACPSCGTAISFASAHVTGEADLDDLLAKLDRSIARRYAAGGSKS